MIKPQLDAVLGRIRAAAQRSGRDPASITLVAVSKTRSVDEIREAITAGITHFGENRVQEAAPKVLALRETRAAAPWGGPDRAGSDEAGTGRLEPAGPAITWHLVGHLQSNKAGKAVELFDLIHSIDSEPLAREVGRRALKVGRVQPVLIQVNCSGEAAKSGCPPGDAVGLARAVSSIEGLDLRGFMTIGPLDPDPESARPAFRELGAIRGRARDGLGKPLPELSMGMTADLEIAVEEGATLVRVGTALFGERPAPPPKRPA